MAGRMVPVGRLQVATPASMALAIRQGTEAQDAVDERVEPIAIRVVARSPTVVEAAATAATTAIGDKIAGLDLVETKDDRVLTRADGDSGSFGVFGGAGEHTAATVRVSDGGPTAAAEQILRDRLGVVLADGAGAGVASAAGEATAVSVDPTTGLLTGEARDLMRLSVRERASRINTFARTSVRVPVDRSPSRPLVSSRTRLLITGDSHAEAGDVPLESRWHVKLGQQRPDLTLKVAARGGSTTHMVALMAGAIEPTLTLTGGSLPASGQVTASIADPLKYRTDVGLPVTPGVAITAAVEIPVTLERTPGEALFVLKRTTPGDAIAGPVRFRAATWDNNGNDTMLVIAGQNDQITTPGNVAPVAEGYSAMIASRVALNPHALFMGLVLGASSSPYSPNWVYNLEIDLELQRLWPEHYWSLARWLVEDALDLVAITPTAQDDIDRKSYRTPRSLLLADGIHMNAATQAALAPVLVNELVARNLIDPA